MRVENGCHTYIMHRSAAIEALVQIDEHRSELRIHTVSAFFEPSTCGVNNRFGIITTTNR
jgi:hypothetical protein